MATGISIHVGLDILDSKHYCLLPPRLFGSESDAAKMADLAEAAGFDVKAKLLGAQATAPNVIRAIQQAIAQLTPTDILLITYSGHGSTTPDLNKDEADGYDETWCLFDRQILDDELYALWKDAPVGSRILVVSDSCHSGSVTRGLVQETFDGEAAPYGEPDAPPQGSLLRGLTDEGARKVFECNQGIYEQVQKGVPGGRRVEVAASVLLLGACQAWESAIEQGGQGIFTRELIKVWDGGRFLGTYLDFYTAIYQSLQVAQRPTYERVGQPQPAFDMQRPFFIDVEKSKPASRGARAGKARAFT
jgi:hypothetical protein